MKKFSLNLNTIQIFEQVEDIGINIIDASGRFICFSKGSEIMDSMKREDVIGRHVLEVYKFYDGQVSPALRVLKNGLPMKDFSINYKNNNGKHVEAISSIYPIFDKRKKEIIGSMCIYRDKSDFVKLSRRVEQLEEELKKRTKNDATVYAFSDIIGESDTIKNCIRQAQVISKTSVPVLILGETGTGKEVFAQSIHNYSQRKNKPFIAVNCSAIPENLLESTLFGTVRGAFTGASNTQGLFEAAQNGTLFLDEINSMSPLLQSKILRVLETGFYRKVGSTTEKKISAQIISAMNETPETAIENGHLRSDLYYRLSAFTITLPPLRNRTEDIILLTNTFIHNECLNLGRSLCTLSEEAYTALCQYHWPGNIRELKHTILHALLVAPPNTCTIEMNCLPEYIQISLHQYPDIQKNSDFTLKTMTANFQREIIINTLKSKNKNITKSAEALGLLRQNLQHKIKTLNININDI